MGQLWSHLKAMKWNGQGEHTLPLSEERARMRCMRGLFDQLKKAEANETDGQLQQTSIVPNAKQTRRTFPDKQP